MRSEEPGVRLAAIHIYPMKAARAVDLSESPVEPWGLAGGRRWLLVDENGRFISQREEPSLARVVGDVPFRVVKPCGRCVVTTTDQVTGERGRQPLTMLGRRRRFGKRLVFGQNLIRTAAA